VPHTVIELLELLELERLEVDLYRGRQPDTLMQRVFGGQVAAQALRAASHTVEPERAVHSLHSYFLRPGDTAVPIVYDVERIRDGHSFSTRRVAARQHGKPIYYLTASFQRAEPGFTHSDAMPHAPAPEDCPTLGDVVRRLDPDRRQLDHVRAHCPQLVAQYARLRSRSRHHDALPG